MAGRLADLVDAGGEQGDAPTSATGALSRYARTAWSGRDQPGTVLTENPAREGFFGVRDYADLAREAARRHPERAGHHMKPSDRRMRDIANQERADEYAGMIDRLVRQNPGLMDAAQRAFPDGVPEPVVERLHENPDWDHEDFNRYLNSIGIESAAGE